MKTEKKIVDSKLSMGKKSLSQKQSSAQDQLMFENNLNDESSESKRMMESETRKLMEMAEQLAEIEETPDEYLESEV
jgi:hypothetical protein